MSSCSRNSPLKEMLYLQFIHLYLNRNMQVLTPSYFVQRKKTKTNSSSYPGLFQVRININYLQ